MNTTIEQSSTSNEYCQLIGMCVLTFSSNFTLMMENISSSNLSKNNCKLIDEFDGNTYTKIPDTFDKNILNEYKTITDMYYKIIHSFCATTESGKQILVKIDEKTNKQFYITEEYMKDFIKRNEDLSRKLHEIRGY